MAGRAARKAVEVRGLAMVAEREAALKAAALNADMVPEIMRQLEKKVVRSVKSHESSSGRRSARANTCSR